MYRCHRSCIVKYVATQRKARYGLYTMRAERPSIALTCIDRLSIAQNCGRVAPDIRRR